MYVCFQQHVGIVLTCITGQCFCTRCRGTDGVARAFGSPDTIITERIYERSLFKLCFYIDHVQRGVISLPLCSGIRIVDENKSMLRAQVKEMEFIYESLYRLPYHSLPHLRTWGTCFCFSSPVIIAEQGNHVKIPVILGCTAPGLLYAYGNSLTTWTFLSLQPIGNDVQLPCSALVCPCFKFPYKRQCSMYSCVYLFEIYHYKVNQ